MKKLLLLTIPLALLGVGLITANSLFAREIRPDPECLSCTYTDDGSLESLQVDDGEPLEGLKLMAGTSYQLVIGLNSQNYSGEWNADHGTVSATGVYTAPNYMPPYAEDIVRFESTSGFITQVRIIVEPNPALPNSDGPRFIRVAYPSGDPNFDIEQSATIVEGSNEVVVTTGTLVDLATANPSLPLAGPGEVIPGMPEVFDCVEVDTLLNNQGVEIADLPETDGVSTDKDIYAVLPAGAPTPQTRPKICKIGPHTRLGKLIVGKPCTTPTKQFEEITTYGPKEIPPPQTGEMTYTHEVHALLGIKGLAELGSGYTIGVTYSMTRQLYKWRQRKIFEFYKCIDGVYKYSHSIVHWRTGLGEKTMPAWVAVVDGYPPNGDPQPNLWTSWIQN